MKFVGFLQDDEGFNVHDFPPVEVPEWAGPKIVNLYSYSWPTVATMWQRYRRLLPREELREYSEGWGKYDGETGRARVIAFGSGRPTKITLKCGTVLQFNCYSQGDIATEGYQSDLAHFDEQPDKKTWLGWLRGTTTRGDKVQACFTLTGRTMKDRPDTGGSGWVRLELWNKAPVAQGMKVGRYHLSLDSTPDQIITPAKKKALYDRWVNPGIARTESDARRGLAVALGGWEPSGGLVFDNWDRAIHLVNRFDIPSEWEKGRFIDHGENPCAMMCFAVSPNGNIFAYREYYVYGLSIVQNAKGIIEACGHTRKEVGKRYDDDTGATWPVYEEMIPEGGEYYRESRLDRNSFGSKQGLGLTIGALYNMSGCNCGPAVGQKDDITIPLLYDLLSVDKMRRHVVTGKWGAPTLYAFDDLTYFVGEIESWARSETTNKPRTQQADHLISCAKFMAGSALRCGGMQTMAEWRKGIDGEMKKRDLGYKMGKPIDFVTGKRIVTLRRRMVSRTRRSIAR